mmetsp:Transcript_70315/g.201476  ORF Transcript_70315/g.201476 Transcript_70315/m.201476 type:complete len:284 (+) Transcript_70315:76-927(+)
MQIAVSSHADGLTRQRHNRHSSATAPPSSSPLGRQARRSAIGLFVEPNSSPPLLLHGPAQRGRAWVALEVAHIHGLATCSPGGLQACLGVLISDTAPRICSNKLRGPQKDVGLGLAAAGRQVRSGDDAIGREDVQQSSLLQVCLHGLPQSARRGHHRHPRRDVCPGHGHGGGDRVRRPNFPHAALVYDFVIAQKLLHKGFVNLFALLALINIPQDVRHGPTAVRVKIILSDRQIVQLTPSRPSGPEKRHAVDQRAVDVEQGALQLIRRHHVASDGGHGSTGGN